LSVSHQGQLEKETLIMLISVSADGFADTIPPPHWPQPVSSLGGGSDTGYENEDLIVWMRTAAFPTFRKLYRRVDHRPASAGGKEAFERGLPAGNYTLSIAYGVS
jgi:hypothetical protein